MANTIDIMFEILDNISNKWKEEKIFIYGQGTDSCSDPTHAFEYTNEVFGVRAKSEEEGRILLHFQFSIMEGYISAEKRGKDVLECVQKTINVYYGAQTVKQVKDYILYEPHYEVHTFDLREKIIFEVKTFEGPEWIEKYYTGDSEDYIRTYQINIEESDLMIWDINKMKKELNYIRRS